MALGDVAAKLGVPVFACGENKRPVTETGFKAAVTDPARILAMFERPGAALIGMPTGAASGLVVIDIDIRTDRTGMDWLQSNADALPETRTHKTRSGGLHLVFRAPSDATIRNSQARLAPGVDVRGEGGYVIIPPSPGYSIADATEPAEMPRWLMRACAPPPAPQTPPAAPSAPRQDGGSRYGLAALRDECDTIRCARWGEQESKLNAAALKIGALVAGGELNSDIARADLVDAGNQMSSEPNREPWCADEVREKVRRGMDHGASRPRQAPRLPDRPDAPPPLDDEGYWQAVEADVSMSADAWHELEARETGHAASPSPAARAAAGVGLLRVLQEGWEEADIPPRPWIAKGYLMRSAVTVLSGPGSAGKSSVMVAWSVCLALGCAFAELKTPHPMRVGIYNVEDDEDEQKRRFSAMAQRLAVHPSTFMANLAILGPTRIGTLVQMDPSGRVLISTPVMDALRTWVAEFEPDVLILDPFVELHGQEENDNTAIRAVMAFLRGLATEFKMAIVVLHHSRKGETTPGDPDSLRGASAIVGAARVVLTINVMTADEAKTYNISDDDRRDYFRLDGAKSNYASLESAEWFERQERRLANGDSAVVAWPWRPKTALSQVPLPDIGHALDRIAAGYAPGVLYRPSQVGGKSPRWVGNVVMQEMHLDELQAKTVVATWLSEGLLVRTEYMDPSEGKLRPGVLVETSRRPA